MTRPEPAPLTPRSQRVRRARRLASRSERAERAEYLAEGPQSVREALRQGGIAREVFATAVATARFTDLVHLADEQRVPWRLSDEAAVGVLSDTVTPQGVIARCGIRQVSPDALLAASPRLLAVLDAARDPGNTGAVIRCADAAGADGVFLVGDGVDPYNPKAVRASAGSIFHLPVVPGGDPAVLARGIRHAGLQVLAADPTGRLSLDELADEGRLAAPTAWVFGNEAHGLSAATRALADEVVRVPIHGGAESLNLAAAAAVCLYASARELRRPGCGNRRHRR